MKKGLFLLTLIVTALFSSAAVHAETLDYQTAVKKINENNQLAVIQNFADSKGATGKMVIMVEPAYTQSAMLSVKETPDNDGNTIRTLSFGQKVSRVGLCDNGWSKVLVRDNAKRRVYGYVESYYLSDEKLLTEMEEELTVVENSEVLDFPGVRNGLSVGKVVKNEKVLCTGICNNEWSRIRTENAAGEEFTGFVQNSILTATNSGPGNVTNSTGEDDLIEGEAVLKQPVSEESLWAKAMEGVTQEGGVTTTNVGAASGDVVKVPAGAKLKPLGTFRITHYCPCSICCGPWTNGITATGVTAKTNHTIAVYPSQIPYGSKVVIGGQVFVAEDCGGGITENCIDIYVATHEEGEAKGVYYTDVYLLEE